MQLTTHDLVRLRAAFQEGVRQHFQDENIGMIDIGYRQKGGEYLPELTLRFHVHEKIAGLESSEGAVDKTILDVPTDVIEASYALRTLQTEGWTSNPRAQTMNPMRGGISISDAYSRGYGTLGGVVLDEATGEPMLLSNFHVMASRGYARPGAAILQPGRGDGGYEPVAYFIRHGMDQGIDAAVARLSGEREIINEQFRLGRITGVRAPMLGMRVCKSGRASDVTHGMITGFVGNFKVAYPGSGMRRIRSVMHIAPIGGSGEVSAPGDSGSIWVDEATHAAVGLHFAGGDDPENALAIDMAEVLKALHVRVA